MQRSGWRRRIGLLGALAGSLGVAVLLFGVPLGTALSVGVLFLCPILMQGMHGHGAGDRHEAETPAASPGGQGTGSSRFIPWDSEGGSR